MQYKLVLRHLVVMILALGVFVSVFNDNTPALAQEDANIAITSPSADATLSGVVTVTGTVNFTDFIKFEILLKSGDNLSWVATIYAPVFEGNLARMDTRLFLDGPYQLVVRQVNSDSNYTDFFGPTITIANGTGSTLPYPELDSNFLYAPPEHALARVRNCGLRNMEFDYNAPTGFCSAGDLWIPPRQADSSYCPSVDILLIACEYRGTIIGEGDPPGVTYLFEAEKGKIYQFDYPGGDQVYIGEIPADEMTAVVADQPSTTTTNDAAASSTSEDSSQPEVLPVSGQGETANWTFLAGAIVLIILLIIGGILAVRKQRSAV